MHTYYVYILSNEARRMYTGMSSELFTRMFRHKTGAFGGYTAKHGVTKLVYFETTNDVRIAIAREKQLKRWPRARKVALIERENAGWLDLAIDWFPELREDPVGCS